MHVEVDNEEGSTVRLYKSMPYKMYGIMHNLRSIKTTTTKQQRISMDFNQLGAKKPKCEALHFSTKHGIIIYGTENWSYS